MELVDYVTKHKHPLTMVEVLALIQDINTVVLMPGL